jgi:hypothetical protein
MVMSTSVRSREAITTLRPPLWLRIGFWACIVIAVGAVLRRLVALATPVQAGPPDLVALDTYFATHFLLTLIHIVPALAFVALTPLIYMRRFATVSWPERALFPLGGIVGLTAYAMSTHAIGGWLERSAVLLFNTLFLCALGRSFWYRRLGQRFLQLQWLTRAIGILLGIATTRPVMGVFFATSPFTHLHPSQFFGIAFWIGFSINTLIVEWWVRSQRGQSALERIMEQPQA